MLKCKSDGYFRQIKPYLYKISDKFRGPAPYLTSLLPRFRDYHYEGWKENVEDDNQEKVEQEPGF